MNLIAIITLFISATYTSYYGVAHQAANVAIINGLLTAAYAGTLVLNAYQQVTKSKVWFFSILMLHLFICTHVLVTNQTGFQLYYFLVPTGAFLLFELKQKKEKVLLSAASIILFFICENTPNPAPLIQLGDDANHIIYQSVVLVIMLEVLVVMTLFVKQIELYSEQLLHQANSDSLTGIANRRYFFDKAKDIVSRANLRREPLALMIIDFDHFKQINDQHGHFVGDQCLIEISRTIQQLCRESDILARLGGEEFVVALPNTKLDDALNIAERMRTAIESKQIPTLNQQDFHCTASLALALIINKKWIYNR